MTTETKAMHTPGPWKHFDGSRFITATYNGIDTPLAEICVLPRKEKFFGYDGAETLTELTEAEEQLNANVLAAAPDMLEALEHLTMLLRDIRNLYPSNPAGEWLTKSKCYTAALQAIQKAKGGAA